ncbi:MAG: hypothetical protein KGJ84_13890 [Elusimicrobia bacterium]|nr:hypothetical protein [Elusimicrobiota bacterium]
MAKRKHGRVAVRRRQPSLFELLKKDQARVLAVLSRHGVYIDPGTFVTLSVPLEKVAAYHAVPDKKKFLHDLLGR